MSLQRKYREWKAERSARRASKDLNTARIQISIIAKKARELPACLFCGYPQGKHEDVGVALCPMESIERDLKSWGML